MRAWRSTTSQRHRYYMHGLSSAFLSSSFINDAQRLVICLFNSLTVFYCSYFVTLGELFSKHSSSALRTYGNTTSVRPANAPFVLLVFRLWTYSNIKFLMMPFLSSVNFLRLIKPETNLYSLPLGHFTAAYPSLHTSYTHSNLGSNSSLPFR